MENIMTAPQNIKSRIIKAQQFHFWVYASSKLKSWRDTCVPVLTAALFQEQMVKCPLWMNGKQNVVYTHNGLLLNLKKEGNSDM